jgi:c-di-GMP-binding flagellar brake protein YcgR
MFESPVPHSLRDSFLDKACARSLRIEVTPLDRKPVLKLKSRFLQNEPSKGHILIDVPTAKGAAIVLHPGREVRIEIAIDGDLFAFDVPVIGRSRARLIGAGMAALTIGYPRELMRLQRRQFFRARIPTLSPIRARCVVANERASDKTGPALTDFAAQICDISCGGVGIRLGDKWAHLARTGRRWAVKFSLPGIEHAVHLIAEIRHVRKGAKPNEVIVGVQFVNGEATAAGKKALANIACFVARRQREELKKKSGLE